jgi:CRISPR-associated exonuclease Cas4
MQLYLAIILVITALLLFLLAARERRKLGIPAGKVIYVDASSWDKVEKPLYDADLHLTGKPDYLVKQGNKIVPVEVKSRNAPRSPHDSHVYQLGAYCLLVEREFKQRPSHGILHYSNKTYAIDYTRDFENNIKDTIREMQTHMSKEPLNRSHQDEKRCQHCGYRSICDQSLRL